MNKDSWNKCDICGKFIRYNDFHRGAIRSMITPSSLLTTEEWETLCINCNCNNKKTIHERIVKSAPKSGSISQTTARRIVKEVITERKKK